MGSGYNTSLAMGRSARNKSNTRPPFHFWTDVPVYVYELECLHEFRTRTLIVENAEEHEELLVWCDRCREYLAPYSEPINQPSSNDELIAFEQDKGILRERFALEIQAAGYLDTDEDVMKAAQRFGVPVKEIRKINAGLVAGHSATGAPDMCRTGLHELTPDNLIFKNGRRRCRACDLAAQRARRARSKV